METFSSHFDIPVINHQFEKSQFCDTSDDKSECLVEKKSCYKLPIKSIGSLYHALWIGDVSQIEIFQTGDL